MKGMRKIVRGDGILAALLYVFFRDANHKDTPGILIGGNLPGLSPEELSKEFETVFLLRPDIKKPVWHNSLRLPAGEQISERKWVQIADAYMLAMGFSDEHPRCHVLHADEDGQHIHILASRISLSGTVYLGKNENLRSTQIISKLEMQFGLQLTKPAQQDVAGKIHMPNQSAAKKGELELSVRTGIAPPRLRLQTLIGTARVGMPSVFQFIERLELSGVAVFPNVTSTGQLNGFAFELDGIRIKGSNLGKFYTWKNLSKDIPYDQNRDGPRLCAITNRETSRGNRYDCSTPANPRRDETSPSATHKCAIGNPEIASRSELAPSTCGIEIPRSHHARHPAQGRMLLDQGVTKSTPERPRLGHGNAQADRRQYIHGFDFHRHELGNGVFTRATVAGSCPTHPSLECTIKGAWRPNGCGQEFWLSNADFDYGNPSAFTYEDEPQPCLLLNRQSDAAILSMLMVADEIWEGQFEVFGSDEFVQRAQELMKKHQLGCNLPTPALADCTQEDPQISIDLESGMR